MAEITLDDNKIAVPKRLNITTFLSELQKKTKQFIYLIDKKEVGIFQTLNEVKKGMWRKMKIQDDICHHYIDPDTEIEYIVFSDEFVKKLGSFPYEGPSVSKRQQQSMNQSNIPSYAPSHFQNSLPTTNLPHQVSQPSFVIHSSQNLQPPITSDLSFYQQNPNSFQVNHNYPPYSSIQPVQSSTNNFNSQPNLLQQSIPQQQSTYPSYPSLTEIPRYNNLDLNETFQQFANLIQSNNTNYPQPYNQQPPISQPNNNGNNSNSSSYNNQQTKLSSKSLQNLNRIQAFLKQQINQGSQQNNQGQGLQQGQGIQGIQGMQGLNPTMTQPPQGLQGLQQPQGMQQQQNQQQGMNNFSSWNLNNNDIQQQPLFQRVNPNQPFMNPNPSQTFSIQGNQQIQQQQQQTVQPVVSSRVTPIKKSSIPVQLPSAQTIQTIQSESIPGQGSATGRQKYFPPYQGKKKVSIQNTQQTNQNVVPQQVENKFSA
jgi:hypothetical protein